MHAWMKGKRRKQGEMGKSKGRRKEEGENRDLGFWVTVVWGRGRDGGGELGE